MNTDKQSLGERLTDDEKAFRERHRQDMEFAYGWMLGIPDLKFGTFSKVTDDEFEKLCGN